MAPTTIKETPSEKAKKEEKKEKPAEAELELTEEDKQLLDELNLCVDRLKEDDASLYRAALELLRTKIRSSTASLTSVPKPLKFLRPHFGNLKEIHEKIPDGENQRFCADIVSVLGMTMSEERECLKYRMIGSQEEIGSWGHEYVRHLSGEIASEWKDVTESEEVDTEKLEKLGNLIEEIIPYNMKHNGETEACDLLMEINKLDLFDKFVDKGTFQRVCLYLTSCVPFTPDPENMTLLRTTIRIFCNFERYAEAMRLALQLNDTDVIAKIFHACKDPVMQKQLSFILGRQQVFLELDDELDETEDLIEIMSNTRLNTNFLTLARELDIMEPKTPEDIYKTHLENSRPGLGPSGSNVDSARMNLASSYVNGLVNAGFGQDKLVTVEGNKWIYKNKDHGMMAATASLGLVLLWDVDGGLTQIDKYLYSSEDYIKSGALLACGIVNSGVRNDCDPALALLSDYVLHNSNVMRVGAILGLGLAYAGSNREEIISLLLPAMADTKSNMEVVGVTALACGLIAVGSCNGEVTSGLLQTLIERPESDLRETYARYIALALGLVVLGKQEAEEAILAALEVVPEPLRGFARILVDVCAYAGTGNVLKIQEMLHICSEVVNKEDEESGDAKPSDKKDGESSKSSSSGSSKKDSKSDDKKKSKTEWGMSRQAVAVIGIAIVGMGEDIGSEMAFRTFAHMFRYGEPAVRRAVPLALSLISISNPQLPVLDTLSKFSHDSDSDVAHNAIFAMGLVGSGTNNARLAQMLRNLAVYYSKDASNLFLVRLAQGLVHLGKGTLTLQPYHSDRQLLSPVSLGAILSVIVSFLDVKNIILGKSHYLLYSIVPAIQPRMLVTFDEELRPLPISVRVGQAVDVVGQAGKPKTITGFQTHTTPVLLAYGERAELATDEYLPLNPVVEGFVILRKNPDFE